jgi:hypothetical protein
MGEGDAIAPSGASIQDKVLNGAQVTSLVGVVEKVSLGLLPRDAAVNIVQVAFQVDEATAQRLLGTAGKGFVPQVQNETQIQPR